LCLFVGLDVVSNIGQYPLGKGEAYSFLSTGPVCRYAADLLPVFKLMALPEHMSKLQLDQQVTRSTVSPQVVSCTECTAFSV